ncbi:hypothetical protein AVEN_256713-1 [Araneus ventricosus]|uniref:Reverse transcriptase RNase H-like domain-containing protein n=1 Tax=Araneus ventricosus TaxID=182803 RepID=A0A4Y2SN14_ARAVE|nr:hypothetical protein AVEN_256713-1 [Araneus ventricosus]
MVMSPRGGKVPDSKPDPNVDKRLKSNEGSNPRLMRWSLELQPFQYKVIHKAGKNHSNADALSRSETRTCWDNYIINPFTLSPLDLDSRYAALRGCAHVQTL